MRQKIAVFLMSLFLLSMSFTMPIAAYAGIPPYTPIYEIMLLDANENLSVASETLTLLPPEVLRDDMRYSPNMPDMLSANYEINNKGQSARARVAIPFLGRSYDDFSGYELTANGNAIEPVLFYTDITPFWNPDIDFNNVFSGAYSEAVIYEDTLCGTLYTFTGDPSMDITLTLDENQRILYSGGNRSSWTPAQRRLTLGSYAGSIIIFLTCGELNYSYDGSVESEAISYNDFIKGFDFYEGEQSEFILLTHAFDKFLQGNGSSINEMHTLFMVNNSQRLMLLVYDVEFYSGNNTISVTRPIKYTYDYSYEPPLFALHFVNKPIKTWASFGKTTINIMPPPDLPYVIDNEFHFEKASNGLYNFSGELTSFDEYYIVYSSAENPKENKEPFNYKILIIIFAPLVAGGLTFAIFWTCLNKKKRGNTENEDEKE